MVADGQRPRDGIHEGLILRWISLFQNAFGKVGLMSSRFSAFEIGIGLTTNKPFQPPLQ